MVTRIQKARFDVGATIGTFINQHSGGALVSFLGRMRLASNDGDQLDALFIEHYHAMAKVHLQELQDSVENHWALMATLVIHRYGLINPHEEIVLVLTLAKHRQSAFEACQCLMDWLKTEAPFWKWEYRGGQRYPVEARDEDAALAARWQAVFSN